MNEATSPSHTRGTPGPCAERPVDELREAVRQLEERNHELEALAYAAVHELAAPVRSLQALTQPPAHRGDPTRLSKVVSHVSAVVEGLRALARIGRCGLNRQSFDLADVVAEAVEGLDLPAGSSLPAVQVEGRLPIVADRSLVRIVMANLLSNALKFTRGCERAAVSVSRRLEGGRAVIVVADNGIGLPVGASDRVFDPFVRLHPDREDEGVGVGLAIVRAVVEAHGGSVTAGDRVGGGTEVRFSLDPLPSRPA